MADRLARDKSLQRNGTIDLTAAEREAVGRREARRLADVCSTYDVPLHIWFGGALRHAWDWRLHCRSIRSPHQARCAAWCLSATSPTSRH